MRRMGCLTLVSADRESGMVESACTQCRAFSQELPPEGFSRDGRMTPLPVLDVSASEKAALKKRIAGGTAEGMPFVPIVGMEGLFICN